VHRPASRRDVIERQVLEYERQIGSPRGEELRLSEN
jgi:hypothetical protein